MALEPVGSDKLNLCLGRLSVERGTNHLALREVLRIQQYHCQGMRWKPPSGCVDLQISTHQCHELKPSPSCQPFQPDTFICFSFPTASVPSAFSLGALARRRRGGGGGSLHRLPQEKLLENGVHMVADVLWDGNNGCWWEARGEKEESLPAFPSFQRQPSWTLLELDAK